MSGKPTQNPGGIRQEHAEYATDGTDLMRLTCPNCEAQYEVANTAIPPQGREVQCSSCGHTWFERPKGAKPQRAVRLQEGETGQSHQDEGVSKDEVAASGAPKLPRRDLDPSVAEILRAEATRETRERRQESETALESQEEFMLATDGAPVGPDPDDETLQSAMRPAPQRSLQVPRRDLLPDIEEINSSLRAKSVLRSGASAALTEEEREERARRGRGFRIGFSAILLVALFALLLYSNADRVSATVPGLTAPVEGYVTQIDAIRVWLDEKMANGASAISGVLQGASE
ncbi:MAG: zinc-ribbon domain-containing protein [Pseudomonadota bacterium]